jgi:cell division FtsZ-interacting protein ZapD
MEMSLFETAANDQMLTPDAKLHSHDLQKQVRSTVRYGTLFQNLEKRNACKAHGGHPLFRHTRHPLLRLFSRGKWDMPKPIPKQAEINLTNEEVLRGA